MLHLFANAQEAGEKKEYFSNIKMKLFNLPSSLNHQASVHLVQSMNNHIVAFYEKEVHRYGITDVVVSTTVTSMEFIAAKIDANEDDEEEKGRQYRQRERSLQIGGNHNDPNKTIVLLQYSQNVHFKFPLPSSFTGSSITHLSNYDVISEPFHRFHDQEMFMENLRTMDFFRHLSAISEVYFYESESPKLYPPTNNPALVLPTSENPIVSTLEPTPVPTKSLFTAFPTNEHMASKGMPSMVPTGQNGTNPVETENPSIAVLSSSIPPISSPSSDFLPSANTVVNTPPPTQLDKVDIASITLFGISSDIFQDGTTRHLWELVTSNYIREFYQLQQSSPLSPMKEIAVRVKSTKIVSFGNVGADFGDRQQRISNGGFRQLMNYNESNEEGDEKEGMLRRQQEQLQLNEQNRNIVSSPNTRIIYTQELSYHFTNSTSNEMKFTPEEIISLPFQPSSSSDGNGGGGKTSANTDLYLQMLSDQVLSDYNNPNTDDNDAESLVFPFVRISGVGLVVTGLQAVPETQEMLYDMALSFVGMGHTTMSSSVLDLFENAVSTHISNYYKSRSSTPSSLPGSTNSHEMLGATTANTTVTKQTISNTIYGGKENCGADHTCVLVVHYNQLFTYRSMPGINDDFNKEDAFLAPKQLAVQPFLDDNYVDFLSLLIDTVHPAFSDVVIVWPSDYTEHNDESQAIPDDERGTLAPTPSGQQQQHNDATETKDLTGNKQIKEQQQQLESDPNVGLVVGYVIVGVALFLGIFLFHNARKNMKDEDFINNYDDDDGSYSKKSYGRRKRGWRNAWLKPKPDPKKNMEEHDLRRDSDEDFAKVDCAKRGFELNNFDDTFTMDSSIQSNTLTGGGRARNMFPSSQAFVENLDQIYYNSGGESDQQKHPTTVRRTVNNTKPKRAFGRQLSSFSHHVQQMESQNSKGRSAYSTGNACSVRTNTANEGISIGTRELFVDAEGELEAMGFDQDDNLGNLL